jgi:hypothetical protein
MKFSKTKTLITGLCTVVLIMAGGIVAEGAISTLKTGLICANQSSGSLKVAKTCSKKEKMLSTVAGVQNGMQSISERHLIPDHFGSSDSQDIDFPKCPSNAPILISTTAYIPSNSNYKFDQTRSNIVDSAGSISGEFLTWHPDDSTSVPNTTFIEFGADFYHQNVPKSGPFELYMISECAPISGAKTVGH